MRWLSARVRQNTDITTSTTYRTTAHHPRQKLPTMSGMPLLLPVPLVAAAGEVALLPKCQRKRPRTYLQPNEVPSKRRISSVLTKFTMFPLETVHNQTMPPTANNESRQNYVCITSKTRSVHLETIVPTLMERQSFKSRHWRICNKIV